MKENPYILPKFIKPIKYNLELTPNINKLTFTGKESVTLDILEETSIIKINTKEVNITSAKITQSEIQNNKSIAYDKETQTSSINFNKKLSKGKATLYLEFKGKVREDLRGLYKSKYTLPDGKEKTLLTTQFEPVDARSCFPCFDEPALKAIFEVTMNIPKNLTALSNMPIKKETIEKEVKKVSFQETPIMSTYLLAFIVGEFEFLENKTKDNILVRVISTPGKKDHGKFALDVAVKVLDYYEKYFNIRYPLPKLDLIAIPDFEVGAMENWGLITYRETALLIDEKNSSVANKQTVAIVVAHEVAHQWFGNLVTMKWWNDLWLNEGFASWIEYKSVDSIFPGWDLWTQFYRLDMSVAMSLDSLESSHPIEVEVINPNQIGEIFDAVSYSKGACIIRMLEEYLGEEVFKKGLQKYFKKFLYNNAETQDLWNALEEISKKPVKKIMDNWTKQTGYPIISISYNNNKWKLEQERFLYKRKQDSTLWHIPISIKERKKYYIEMKNKVEEITLQDKNPIINSSQVGFYRIRYDQNLLKEKIKQIKDLKTLDRIGLEADTYALTRACHYKAKEFLNLIQEYKGEEDYTIISDIAGNLGAIEFFFTKYSFNKKFDEFTIKLFSDILKKIGWEEKKGEEHTKKLLRMVVLSVVGSSNHQPTLEEAKKRFLLHLKNKDLNPNLRGVVYSLSAFSGDKETFDQLIKLYKETNLQEEKVRILGALSNFKQESLIKEALKFYLSKEVRTQDTPTGIMRIAGNPYAQGLVWNFLKENWDEFKKRYFETGNTIGGIIKAICAKFSSGEKYKEVKDFFTKNPVPSAKRAIEQSLEAIQINTNFVKNNEKDLEEWFKAN